MVGQLIAHRTKLYKYMLNNQVEILKICESFKEDYI